MSISLTILYISAFSAFRAYEVGGAEIGVSENLFSGATPIFATTGLCLKVASCCSEGVTDRPNIGIWSVGHFVSWLVFGGHCSFILWPDSCETNAVLLKKANLIDFLACFYYLCHALCARVWESVGPILCVICGIISITDW